MPATPMIGYRHQHGVGIRSVNLLISLSTCANQVVEEIAETVDITVIGSDIQAKNQDLLEKFSYSILPSFISHPNTSCALIVAAGCEAIQIPSLIAKLRALNPAIEYLVVNEGRDHASAISLGSNGATDLITQSLPGLGELLTPKITIGFSDEPAIITSLIESLREVGIKSDIQRFGDEDVIQGWMLSGAHAILSFTPRSLYPVGTLLAPVINVASDSEFHSKFLDDFDLGPSSSIAEIVTEVLSVFGRQRTFSEYTKSVLPFAIGPKANLSAPKPIALFALNPVLHNLARDLERNFDSIDYLPNRIDISKIAANSEMVILLSTGNPNEVSTANIYPPNVKIVKLSDAGSLGSFARAAAKLIGDANKNSREPL